MNLNPQNSTYIEVKCINLNLQNSTYTRAESVNSNLQYSTYTRVNSEKIDLTKFDQYTVKSTYTQVQTINIYLWSFFFF